MSAPKKVVLAYSGGLDTSIILKWLQTEYGCEVVTFTADLGQGEELEPARAKAEMLGATSIHIEDLREEFVRDFVFPMFRANAVYEGQYLLGTSIARPLISKRLVEIAAETGADAVAHGATGKGNDQVRFELAAYALNPDIKVIAPWREWDLTSRTEADRLRREAPDSHRQGQAGRGAVLGRCQPSAHLVRGQGAGRPRRGAPDYVYQRTDRPRGRARHAGIRRDHLRAGDPVASTATSPVAGRDPDQPQRTGRAHGIGRLDFVENRFVGMKSRGIYETPGGTILLEAHRGIEQITLDAGRRAPQGQPDAALCRADLQRLLVQPEREMLQAAIDASQEHVSGTVRLKLYKGAVACVGRWSDHSLYSEAHVTFEDDAGAYDQADAQGSSSSTRCA